MRSMILEGLRNPDRAAETAAEIGREAMATITGGKETETAITIALLRTSVMTGTAITKGLETKTTTTIPTTTSTPAAGANEGATARAATIDTIGRVTTTVDDAAKPTAVDVRRMVTSTIVMAIAVTATTASNDAPTRITAAVTTATEATIATTEAACLLRRLVFP